MFNAGTAYRNEMNKELRGQSFVTISVRLSNFIAQSGYTITSNAINFTRDVGNIYGIRITFGTSRPSSIYLAGKSYTVDADVFETNDVFEGGLSLSATNLLQYDVAGVEFGINELVFENDDILSTSRLNKVKSRLNLFDPEVIFKRGYSLIKKDGKILDSVSEIENGCLLKAFLYDGSVSFIVRDLKKEYKIESKNV